MTHRLITDQPRWKRIEERLANVNTAERAYLESGATQWAWTPERRKAVLEGRMLPIEPGERPGEPIVDTGQRPLSPFVEFQAMRAQLEDDRRSLKRSALGELEEQAKTRVDELIRQVLPHVEALLPVTEELADLNATLAECRTLSRRVEPGWQPRQTITPGDVVNAALDPSLDLLAPVKVEPRIVGILSSDEFRPHRVQPEEPVEVSEEYLKLVEASKKERARQLGQMRG
jgi:hypothetical protein